LKYSIRFLLFIISLVLGVGSSLTLAQTESTDIDGLEPVTELTVETELVEDDTWFSVSSSLHYIVPSFEAHMGFTDALGQGTDLRTTVSGLFFDNGGFIAAGLNSMTHLNDLNTGINNYIGFGPRFITFFSESYAADAYEPTPDSYSYFALGGLWGMEYYPESPIRPFSEFNVSLPLFTNEGFVDTLIPVFSVTSGFNFYF